MTQSVHRGQFRRRGGAALTGELRISDDGSLELHLWGQTAPPGARLDLAAGAIDFEGELADSPFPGSFVTLFACFQVSHHWGAGGNTERWIAHRALFGDEAVDADARVKRTVTDIAGLDAFAGTPGIDPERAGAYFAGVVGSSAVHELAAFQVDELKVSFWWATSATLRRRSLKCAQETHVSVDLAEPLPIEVVLREIVPVFEFVLTVAQGRHARVESTGLDLAGASRPFRVVAPRIEGPSPNVDEQHREPLFRLGDCPDAVEAFRRARGLLKAPSGVGVIYLAHERSRPRYVEESVRSALLLLSHLPTAGPLEAELPVAASPDVEELPFLPPATVTSLPRRVRALLTQRTAEFLKIRRPEEFVQRLGPAYRWVAFREGARLSAVELATISGQLRALIHLQLLKLLGLEPALAQTRIEQRWRLEVPQ